MTTSNVIIEMQRQIRDLSQAMGRVEGKLDTFIAQLATQDDRTAALDTSLQLAEKALGERMGKVENRQHWYAGAATVVGALFAKYAPGLFGHI